MAQVLRKSSELSEQIIPAVPGEFYDYDSEFSEERPLYVLMKCKANKSRPLAAAAELGSEVNLVFLFGSPTQVCTARTAHASGLLGDLVDDESFGETWIAPARITAEQFEEIRASQDVERLVETCQTTCANREVSMQLTPGEIIAVMTDADKYGLFRVTELTPASVKINACHIQL